MPPEEQYWRLGAGAGTWVVGAICALTAVVLVRLILRERITLQGSMSFLGFLMLLGVMGLFPEATGSVAHALGIFSMANFFFCVAIAALAILHLRSLVTLSRIQSRSIKLVQEVAILQEKLERSLAAQPRAPESAAQDGSTESAMR